MIFPSGLDTWTRKRASTCAPDALTRQAPDTYVTPRMGADRQSPDRPPAFVVGHLSPHARRVKRARPCSGSLFSRSIRMLSFGTLTEKLTSLPSLIFGSSNERRVRSYRPKVDAINALEPQLEKLSDAELRARTQMFRDELKAGKTLDDLLVPAFATVREAAKRTLGQRHFDVQLIGGMVLHEGNIAEMKTGEGKTLVATLAVYLNALAENGVHVVTVNDYLARRDAEWMGAIYKFLGLAVGVIVHGLNDEERKAAY